MSKKRKISTKQEAKVNVARTSSYWDMFEAISTGSPEMLESVLQNTAKPKELLKQKDPQGLTPLKKAIALSKGEIARILVAYGAEPSVRDPLGKVAIHIAAMQGKRELIAPLLVSADSSVNVQDKNGWTPLHYAVRGKHMKAIDWLLYAGADVSLKNKDEKTPIDISEEDGPIRPILLKRQVDLEENPVQLCSAFIHRKQLNYIGPDGSIMFVTSGNWSEESQFMFNVRTRPFTAYPPIPLRRDEQYFCDVCQYRMMQRLVPDETRVKAYFMLFEEPVLSSLVVKVTSKTKFLGELPVTISKYTQHNYTNFLGCADLDLKDAGQFVMVKQVKKLFLTKNMDGMYINSMCPNFMMGVPQGAFPDPPPGWNESRRERELAEAEEMVSKLMPPPEKENMEGEDGNENRTNKNENKRNKPIGSDHNTNADQEGDKAEDDDLEGEQEEEEVVEDGKRKPGDFLEGDEDDECEDFYYISYGWGLYLNYRPTMPLDLIISKTTFERNTIRAITAFYTVTHSSNKSPSQPFTIQIPKTPQFTKTGTVLVFARQKLEPGESEFPDPDETVDEYFLSEDGKNAWGTYWMNKERERWSLLSTGICNKETRIVFPTKLLTTFIGVQLNHGSQKWEREEPGESSSSEEEEGEDQSIQDEEGGGERTEEETEKEARASVASSKKAKKKKRVSIPESIHSEVEEIEIFSESSDGDEDETEVPGTGEEGGAEGVPAGEEIVNEETVEEEGDKPRESTVQEGSALGTAELTGEPDPPPASPEGSHHPMEESDAEATKDENASNLGRPNTRQSNLISDDSDATDTSDDANNNSNVIRDRGNKSNNQGGGDDDIEEEEEEDDSNSFLPPEQRLVCKGMSRVQNSFLALGEDEKKKPKVSNRDIFEESEEAEDQDEPEDMESDEDLPIVQSNRYSLAVVEEATGIPVVQNFTYGPPLSQLGLMESELHLLTTQIATTWRYRNHRVSVVVVFSRLREQHCYDMIIELVKANELYIRAEHWWGEGYKLVSQSSDFPVKSGRLFSFGLEGSMIVESPPGSSQNYIPARTMYYYASTVNYLQYIVRRNIPVDDPKAKKTAKKKEEVKLDTDPDALLEVMAFPQGTHMNGQDIATLSIALAGPDLWYDRHVKLRMTDNVLLHKLVKGLRKDKDVVQRWWKFLLLLGYSEKEVEMEKGKTKNSVIIFTFAKRWFDDNLNAIDRGILKLISVLETMELENTTHHLVYQIKEYKAKLLKEKQQPRYLNLLFHWVLRTKITRNNLIHMLDPRILRPVSDIFLLLLAELLDPSQLYKMGSCMDIEDNVIHAIAEEEIIKDSSYLPFRILIKSRQKKDEIIHYTLLLLGMVSQLEQFEAKDFVITETRKWMETVADTEHDICAKLENLFN